MKKILSVIALLGFFATSATAQTYSATLSTVTCPGSGCLDVTLASAGAAALQVTGSFVGSIVFEVTVDGTNWRAWYVLPSNSSTTTYTTTIPGAWSGTLNGYTHARIRASQLFGGNATATVNFTALSGGGDANAAYIVQTANGTLSNAQVLGSLATGLLKNTTITGVLSKAIDGTDYLSPSSSAGVFPILNQDTSGNAATVTNGIYTSGSYANPTWITSLSFNKLSSTPTTLLGYGITDASPLVGSTSFVTTGTVSTGTWAGLFSAVTAANLTHLTAANIDAGTASINVSGNAATSTLATSAAALATPRAINGVNFDGTSAITVTAAAGTLTGTTLASNVVTSSVTAVGTVTSGTWSSAFGAVTGANLTHLTAANIDAGTAGINVTGNAATATALATARAINGVSFNGTAAITVSADASTLTSTTLASNVVTSSLTGVATVTTGTWSALFGAVTGANLTHLTASHIDSGTMLAQIITDTIAAGSGSLNGSVLALNQTWNTSGNVNAFTLDVTDTASGGSSNMVWFRKGGTSKFKLVGDANGTFVFGGYAMDTADGLRFSLGSAGSQYGGSYWNMGNGNVKVGVLSIGMVNDPTRIALFVVGSTSQTAPIGCFNQQYGTTTCDAMKITATGDVIAPSVGTTAILVANLPTPREGMIVAVTDALITTHGVTVAGGGSGHVLVFYNGTNWIVQ